MRRASGQGGARAFSWATAGTRAATALAAVVGCLALWVAPAMGETVFYTPSPTSFFGGSGGGEGQFKSPWGIAVNDETGDVYVADSFNYRVQQFDAEGRYINQWNGSNTPAGSLNFPLGIAIDNSSGAAKGDVYVPNLFQWVIDVFGPNGEYLRQIEGTPSGTFASTETLVLGVSVDRSGNLWAAVEGPAVPAGTVYEFDNSGAFLSEFAGSGAYQGAVAADSSEYLYFADGDCCAVKFNTEGKRLASIGESAYAISVDQTNHHVFVGHNNGIDEYGKYGEPPSPLERFGYGQPESPCGEEKGLGANYGIAINERTGTVYATEQGEAMGVAIFEAQKEAPPALGAPVPARGMTRTAATVSGAVNPRHNPVTYQFEYGTTTSYAAYTPETSVPACGSEVVAEQSIKGLTPGTTYHYRFVATSPGGTVTGPDQTFTTASPTPPTVITGGASNATLTSATLTGLLDPMGLETSYVLELGTDTSYGTSIAGEVGANSERVAIHVPVIELAPGTTYHYRFVAVNSDGRVYGQDQTFSTPPYEHPIVLPTSEPLLGTPSIAFPTITKEATAPNHQRKSAHRKRRKARHKSKPRHRAATHTRRTRS